MSVSVSVDESDILSLSVGQTVEIEIASLGEETYTGSVTEIDRTGTSSDGVTQYTAAVQLEKQEGMLEGMSASASITIESVEDALIVPAAAVTQTSSTSYVYTSYDEEEGLGGMVEVTTGVSNSSYIEITGGLSEGDVVYYIEEEDSGFSGFEMPGGMGNFGGGSGGFPSGGGSFDLDSMPSGGMPGRN